MPLLTSNSYSQSSRYSTQNDFATWANMNDGNCNTGTATNTSPTPVFIQTDCGAPVLVESIVIGYDKNSVLYGGWGAAYSISGSNVGTAKLRGSNDGTTFTDIRTLPGYYAVGSPSNGLYTVSVNQTWRYLRVENGTTYFAMTEFEVFASESSIKSNKFFAMF